MRSFLIIVLFGFLPIISVYADVNEDKLETNISDRMKNAPSIDQRKPPAIKDAVITKEIQDTLRTEKLSTSAKSIQVISANGHVTLKGWVLSKAEESLIIQKVRSIGGVTMVLNEMQILPEK